MADQLDDLKDQFKQMHDDLEKLAGVSKEETKATKEETKATKEETKATKEETKETKQQTQESKKQNKAQSKVVVDPIKDRKSVLKAMQLQLRQTQMAQGASMSDVAAEHLAGGGGLGGAVKAAVGLKVGQFKHKFDPLNLVKKITGGSKLGVALAGKFMGRSEKSIRSFADLAPSESGMPTPFFGHNKGFGSPSPQRGGQGGGENTSILTDISVTLSKILGKLSGIQSSEDKIVELDQKQIDSERDAATAGKASKSPGKGFLASAKSGIAEFLNWIKPWITAAFAAIKLPLIAAIALLAGAATMLYNQWDNLKSVLSNLKEDAAAMWGSMKSGLADAGTWISTAATRLLDMVKDVFDSIGEFVLDMLDTITGGLLGTKAPTAEEKQKKLVETAKGTGDDAGRAQRTIARQHTEKVAQEGETAKAIETFVPSYVGKISPESKSTTAEELKRGDYDAGATANLLAKSSPTGTPEQKATTGAVTQLVAKSYGEVYKDAEGKPLTPRTDDQKLAAERVPKMVREATRALGNSLSSTATPTAVPSVRATPTTLSSVTATPTTLSSVTATPTEVPGVQPQTGLSLMNAAENKKNAAMDAPTGGPGGNQTVMNSVKNNNTSVNNIHQNMPNPRSGETSYLRSLDRHFAPS